MYIVCRPAMKANITDCMQANITRLKNCVVHTVYIYIYIYFLIVYHLPPQTTDHQITCESIQLTPIWE